MAIPQPEPKDWTLANAQELRVTDREVLALLRATKKRVDAILRELPAGNNIRRAQLEKTRARLLAEQATLFERMGDVVSARRASAASRAARLSAASDAALLSLVGKSAQAQYLYDSALQVSQRAIDVALQRMKFSALPLSQRIYSTSTWMNGRLGKLINETLASGLNAREFARRARDWFNPNTPGGVRYAAMRLARTEINNAFHSMSAQKYAETPWIREVDWNLSGSHIKKDDCDKFAAESPFPADKVPARPHPQCMCNITPVSESEDDFVENFLKGDYDEYLDMELEKNGWNEVPEEDVKLEPSPPTFSSSKLPGNLPEGDGDPEFTSLEDAGLLTVGSEFLYHGDSRKEYRMIPLHVQVAASPLPGAGVKARILLDLVTGEKVGQQASSAAKWWIEKIKGLKKVVARRDDPDYKRDYERGWRAGAGRNDLSRADRRGESDAFYDGFSDRSIGAEKWTRADERDAIDAQRRNR